MSLDADNLSGLDAETLRQNSIFEHAIKYSRLPLCISDPGQPDQPIVFANQAFCDLTGYDQSEILGKNCRFLQGPETTPASVERIRQALASQEVTMVEIVNYRKNGEKFINALQLGPVFNDDGDLIFYFGSQLDISKSREEEIKAAALRTSELLHRLKNIVNVMTVVIKMTGKAETDPKIYGDKITGRLKALGQAHFDTLTDQAPKILSFGHLARTLLLAYAPLGEKQLVFHGPEFELSGAVVTSLTLLLHELATNSVKHGSLGVADGVVDLTWNKTSDGDLHLIWQERHGPEVTLPRRKSGSEIVQTLINASGGTLSFDWRKDGLLVDLVLPV